jgi:hypothetical protein
VGGVDGRFSVADLTDIEAETVFDISGRWKPRSISALIRFWLAVRFRAARNASRAAVPTRYRGDRRRGPIADSCRGAHMSGGLSHRRPKIIVDQVPPAPIRAAAHDIACRASEVHVPAVGTRAIN